MQGDAAQSDVPFAPLSELAQTGLIGEICSLVFPSLETDSKDRTADYDQL
jgi:hypothetical protein